MIVIRPCAASTWLDAVLWRCNSRFAGLSNSCNASKVYQVFYFELALNTACNKPKGSVANVVCCVKFSAQAIFGYCTHLELASCSWGGGGKEDLPDTAEKLCRIQLQAMLASQLLQVSRPAR